MLKIAVKNEPSKTEERQKFLDLLVEYYDLTDLDYTGIATTVFIEKKYKQIVNKLFSMAAELLHVSREQVLDKSRKPTNIVLARDILCIVLRCRCDMSYPEIGKWLGFHNHTGVVLACQKFYTNSEEELKLKELYKDLTLEEIFEDVEKRRGKVKIERSKKCTSVNTKLEIIDW